jgi:pyruvate dehydrogenase E2 component (dihydrolipoamide acetyltransferase)
MNIEIKLPELGENIESGDVVNVLVSEGQTIDANQGICELETDKAVVEIPSPQAGRVEKVHFKKGDTIKVGQALLTLDGGADKDEAKPAAKPDVRESKPAAQKESKQPAPESAAPAVTPPSPSATPGPSRATMEQTRESETGGDDDDVIPAGPAARRLARELGVDLRQVQGSGDRGRITPDDVQAVAQGRPAALAAGSGPAGGAEKPQPAAALSIEPVVPPGEQGQDNYGQVRREKMSKIRKTIAAQMRLSWTTVPHVTNFDDADITELENLRKTVPAGFVGANLKLTTMPFVMKAVAIALRRHPTLNASIDEEKEEFVYKEYVHLGIAVDTPRGLVVPKVRNADRMSVAELSRALATVAERARAVQFSVEELRGGSFTISNMGAVGGAYATPIINHPEVAVLLLGRSRWLPVIRGDNIEKRFMMPLSLSYDHRLVDGAAAARFLNDVIAYLQSPAVLMLAE